MQQHGGLKSGSTTASTTAASLAPAQAPFNPMANEENPFLDDVFFPVSREGIELNRKMEGHEAIPGFDEFVSAQMKATTALAASLDATTATSSPAPAPKPGIAPNGRSGRAVAPGPTQPPPPPPSYDSCVGQLVESPVAMRGEPQDMVPLPFLKTRLPPMRHISAQGASSGDASQEARLSFLAGGGPGSPALLAGPGRGGGLRMWPTAGTNLASENSPTEVSHARPGLGAGASMGMGEGPSQDSEPDSAPSVSAGSRTMGVATAAFVDRTGAVVWVGNSTGEVTRWDLPTLRLRHKFQAHRGGSVTALLVTDYGDLWTGSSRGSLRLWARGAMDSPQSNADSFELRRAGGERAHGKVQGMCHVSSSNTVWSLGIHSLAVWDATNGNFKASVGQLEKEAMHALEASFDTKWAGAGDRSARLSGDMGGDMPGEAPTHVHAHAGASGRGRSLSRAASQVLEKGLRFGKRAVTKSVDSISGYGAKGAGIGGEHVRVFHAQTVAAALDARDNVWVGYQDGTIEVYDSITGAVVKTWRESAGLASLAAVGTCMWAGFDTGQIVIWDARLEVAAVWRGHASPVISIAAVGPRVFTLAHDGSVFGWHHRCANEWREDFAKPLVRQCPQFLSYQNVKVFAGTWNVNQMKLGAISASLPRWIGAGAAMADVAVIGLQEIEMGGRSVAESIVKDTFARGMQERGNLTAQTWLQEILIALNKSTQNTWHRVGSRQLSGILLGVFVRSHLRAHVGEVETGSVARGVMGVGGNKGSVAVAMSLHRRRLLFLCSHFAAHQNAVAKRNEDYTRTVEDMKLLSTFPEFSGGPGEAGVAGAQEGGAGGAAVCESAVFRNSDLIVWLGDFNYRINLPYDDACHAAYAKKLDVLRAQDQWRIELDAGRVFHGFSEGVLGFAPTYKFNKRSSTYDTSEKQRIPAWCDRIMFRSSKNASAVLSGYGDLGPKLLGAKAFPKEPVSCMLAAYDSCHGIVDSDHKPVFAVFDVRVCCVDETAHRRLAQERMDALFPTQSEDLAPQVTVQLAEQAGGVGGVRITNAGGGAVEWEVLHAADGGIATGIYVPRVVAVSPSRGVLARKAARDVVLTTNMHTQLKGEVHRLERVRLEIRYRAYGTCKKAERTTRIDVPLRYERYFHSL